MVLGSFYGYYYSIITIVAVYGDSLENKIVLGYAFSEFKSIYSVFLIIIFFYRIYPVSSIKYVGIVTFTASKGIVAGVAVEDIIPFIAIDSIVAFFSVKSVVSIAALKSIVAGVTNHIIIALITS